LRTTRFSSFFTLPFSEPISCAVFVRVQMHPDARTPTIAFHAHCLATRSCPR
jgi:hypothetical protein